MKFPGKKIMPRYNVIVALLMLVGLGILAKTAYIMFAERDFWLAVSKRSVVKNIPIRPVRGNIYSSDGRLLVSSLPEYNICMDYVCTEKDSAIRVRTQNWRDSMITAKADSIGEGLHKLFPEVSTQAFKTRLLRGRLKKRRYWKLYNKRVSYSQFQEVKKLPLFRESRNKSGFFGEPFYQRTKPFGSLAGRTLGEVDGRTDTARYGLELAFDTLLRGKWGSSHRRKVLDRYLKIIDSPQENGYDIVSTIDVEMQDVAEKALVDQLKEIDAPIGLAVLMEVSTGDVKAIVNMTRGSDGKYRETRNYAVSNLLEPGSVFKTASFMVAMDDGYLHVDDIVDTGNGVKNMHGRNMKDSNWRSMGGFGVLTAAECIEKSSNVGVSYFIDKFYYDQPEKFVDGLYRIGLAEDLKLSIPGYACPRIRRPMKNRENWSKTALAWMSIGYETQVPPISTLAFYNGIANGGKMLRPRFVKSLMKNGEVVQEYPVTVVRERMCSPKTLNDIKMCLELVVKKGTGKKVRSKNFRIAGKSGTAQIWTKAGRTSEYLVTFVGYFPADNPKYSCIVCIRKNPPAAGGTSCGPVFKRIAETVMARTMRPSLEDLRDTVNTVWPYAMHGDISATKSVLSELHIPYRLEGSEGMWGVSETNESGLVLERDETGENVVPDVAGMGVRDALFLLESKGLHVSVSGTGQVVKQSIPAGSSFKKNQEIKIFLEIPKKRKPVKKAVPVPAVMPGEKNEKTTHDSAGTAKKEMPANKPVKTSGT